MIQIKKVQGTSLQAAPQAAVVTEAQATVWLWRATFSRRGVIQQITSRSFEAMAFMAELRKRSGWAMSGRIKVRQQH
jgi:hypothetical protein